jgi:GT2 family glycosyltransferase
MTASAAHVAIGIPAWRAGAFVGETLASLAAQTHRDWSAVISVDGGDEETVAACAPFQGDPRFRLVVQPHRLGWVGNCNAVLSMADGDYVMLLPHDDLLAPRYLETLLAHAGAHPEAACVYCDLAVQGQAPGVQPSVCGPAIVRQLTLLAGHVSAVAFRGLVRRSALAAVGGPRENEVDNFAADTVWMAQLARAGELHRVAQTLYEKRYHASNTHTAWARWETGRQRHAWLVHCRDMLAEALLCAADATTRQMLLTVAIGRLIAAFPQAYPFAWLFELDQPAKLALAEEFLATDWARTEFSADIGGSIQGAAWRLTAPHLPAQAALDRLAGEVAKRDHVIEDLTGELARLRAEVGRLEAERAERQGEHTRLLGLVGEMGQANAGLGGEVSRLTQQLLASERERNRLADENTRLRASTSWRITAPLRAVRDHIRPRR